MALAAYRALLRQIHSTFQGDALAIRTASKEIMAKFKANRTLTAPEEIQRGIADAEEARMFIKESIVQAQKSSCGTYAVKPKDAAKLQGMAPNATEPLG